MSTVFNYEAQTVSVTNALTVTPFLPALTAPAAAGDLRKYKQAIDENGTVLEGTLQICDSVYADETLGVPGSIAVQIASEADDSTKELTIACADLLAENIVENKTLFGIAGTAKKITRESGVWAYGDSPENMLHFSCSPCAKLVVADAISPAAENKLKIIHLFAENKAGVLRNTLLDTLSMAGVHGTQATLSDFSDGFTMPSGNLSLFGYGWTAYYWE
nr:MAG TPA: hypothetical protein [Caudoviricetes sp.]